MQAYPCLCAYYAIYRLGRLSFYLMVPHHTSSYSLLANAMLMCRFAPALAFNYMAAIALPPNKSHSPGRDVTETVGLASLVCTAMGACASPCMHLERHPSRKLQLGCSGCARRAQVFYEEFGVLMMHQPLIGWDFTTYLPAALVPYIVLLVFNVFNRLFFCMAARSMEFEDDFEVASGKAARGLALLQQELENHNAGQPLGLTIQQQGVVQDCR